MKIRELAQHWEQNAAGTLSPTGHVLHLDLESEARLAALIDMYPKRTAEELLGELVAAALEELEASFPMCKAARSLPPTRKATRCTRTSALLRAFCHCRDSICTP